MVSVASLIFVAVPLAFVTPGTTAPQPEVEDARPAAAATCVADGSCVEPARAAPDGPSLIPVASQPPKTGIAELDRLWIPQPCKRTGNRMVC